MELPSFEEKERPPIDFFKAIFEESDDDDEDEEEEKAEEGKCGHIEWMLMLATAWALNIIKTTIIFARERSLILTALPPCLCHLNFQQLRHRPRRRVPPSCLPPPAPA